MVPLVVSLGLWGAHAQTVATPTAKLLSAPVGTTENLNQGGKSVYTDQQITIEGHSIEEENIEISYPQIIVNHPVVQEKINKKLRQYAEKLASDTRQMNTKEGTWTRLTASYFVTSTTNGIFSVAVYAYTLRQNELYGLNVGKGFTFDLTTGKEIPLSYFGNVTKKQILEAALKAQSGKDVIYLHDKYRVGIGNGKRAEIPYIAQNFFVDENRNITLIYPAGVLGRIAMEVPLGRLHSS